MVDINFLRLKVNLLLFYLVVANVLYVPLKGQIGTEFWFAAPEVSSGHGDTPIILRISSYSTPVLVTVSQPANGSFVPISISLGAYQSDSVDLTSRLSAFENTPANNVLNKGLYIQSTANITVYYEVQRGGVNKDIYTLKADNALGTSFIIPSQSTWENSQAYSPNPGSTFEIVATEDATSVTITPSQNITGHSAGTSFTITLNKGQTYSARASSYLASNHLAGTEVTSSQPIAITISDDSGYYSTYGSCEDLLGDQIVPISVLGDEYIVMRGFLEDNSSNPLDDKIYVTAVYDNTSIYIDGSNTASATINKGDQYVISLSALETYINTDKDAYVVHVTGYGCEVGCAILPPIRCTGTSEVSFTRSSAENFYLIVLVPAGGQGQFEINGDTKLLKANQFSTVTGTNGQWKTAKKQYSTTDIGVGTGTLIKNNNKDFHVGIINGSSSTGCFYGYFPDYGPSVVTQGIFHY